MSAALAAALQGIIVFPTATASVLGFESDALGANVQSGNDALWWSIMTISTTASTSTSRSAVHWA